MTVREFYEYCVAIGVENLPLYDEEIGLYEVTAEHIEVMNDRVVIE